MQFAFARSADLIGEDANGFRSWFLDGFDLASQSIFDMQHSPWLQFAGNVMPRPVVRLLSKEIGTLLDMREVRHQDCFPFPAPNHSTHVPTSMQKARCDTFSKDPNYPTIPLFLTTSAPFRMSVVSTRPRISWLPVQTRRLSP